MSVELILTKPVENLGAEADLVKVKPGYARNWLLPQGLATRATSATKKQIEALRQARAEREGRERQAAEELASKLNKLTLTFQMNVGEETDKIFGSVTHQDITSRLAEMGHILEKKKIQLAQPLKTLGEHLLDVNLGYDIHAKLKIVLDVPAHVKTEQESEKKGKKDKKDKGDKKDQKEKNEKSGKDEKKSKSAESKDTSEDKKENKSSKARKSGKQE